MSVRYAMLKVIPKATEETNLAPVTTPTPLNQLGCHLKYTTNTLSLASFKSRQVLPF